HSKTPPLKNSLLHHSITPPLNHSPTAARYSSKRASQILSWPYLSTIFCRREVDWVPHFSFSSSMIFIALVSACSFFTGTISPLSPCCTISLQPLISVTILGKPIEPA